MPPPRKLLDFSIPFFFFLCQSALASPSNVKFDFQSLSLRNLTLLGDSYIRNGIVGLTRELGVPTSSSGTIIYDDPIRFFDSEWNTTASFSTRFTFSIQNINPTSYGDGLTFFLSPDNQTLGSPGGYLGLVNSSQLTKNRFIAIEFDTCQDLHFEDPNGDHVGFDIDSLISIRTADPVSQGIDLKSGNSITAWIDYRNDKELLNLYLSYNSSKPETPLLTVETNLSAYLKEFMYVGFSASTEGSTELHLIESWSFRTSGLHPGDPLTPPHNVSDNSVIMPPIPIPISTSPNKHNRRIGWAFGIVGPAFFCLVLIVLGWVSIKKWRNITSDNSFKAELVTAPRQFSYGQLNSATKGFHHSRIIGRGAFGTVYKAYFQAHRSVSAVKRSKHATHEGKTEFMAELKIIACLRHKNLVQLQGWCVEKGELLLVYEFMPNGSLDRVLYQECEEGINPLDWAQRYNIAIGLASVLAYLHQECEQQVIHRDIKTSNVMLDANFNPRLGDFGLARLMDHDKSPVSTLTAGTMGYLAPEYLQYGKATEMTDVFSYGVVMLELACGRRPIERDVNDSSKMMMNLVDWVWGLHSEGRVVEAADRSLKGRFEGSDMEKLLMVGLSCANPDSTARPSMRRVLQILNDEEAPPLAVPKMKPSLTFSCSLPRMEDIVSDEDDDDHHHDEHDHDGKELKVIEI
ncbi:probable L-type lectin-domain containing receptor kinase S.7 [Impatiens glandulifera]|uniref:probable L-type lectin-domain containing receptor kinase S.7 n=1 Tax=Impatiens glandulifera TaxID=253017 RepID=UPI001FB0869F|nr:probable L-type lectin-domain containing receptor kinase S.7 [Impatiens glandulifera]